MTLKEWIALQGGAKKASLRLGVKPDAIRQWLRGKGSPTAKMCMRIIKESEGQLTFDVIYLESTRTK